MLPAPFRELCENAVAGHPSPQGGEYSTAGGLPGPGPATMHRQMAPATLAADSWLG